MIIAAQPVNAVSGEPIDTDEAGTPQRAGMDGFMDTIGGILDELNFQPLINAAGTALTPPGTMVQGPGGTIVRQAAGYPAPYFGTGIGANISGVSSGLGTGLMIGAGVLVVFLLMRRR